MPMTEPDPRPYITLAQLCKKFDLAESGGKAKALVRAGGMLVNGEAEIRPGRKLRNGDVVTIGGQRYEVEISDGEKPADGK